MSNLKRIELVLDDGEREVLLNEMEENLIELRLDMGVGIRIDGDEKLVKLYEYLIEKVGG